MFMRIPTEGLYVFLLRSCFSYAAVLLHALHITLTDNFTRSTGTNATALSFALLSRQIPV